jgi:hypothetical protein
MHELPVAALLATEAVRRQFEPDPPARPRRRPVRPVRSARAATAAALHRAARAIAPPPECGTAH